jgi:long-chain acyl-CoA synthetase
VSESLDLTALGRPAARAPAVLLPDGAIVPYGHLERLVGAAARQLDWPAKALVLVDAPRTLRGVVGYLAALRSGHAVMLIEHGSEPVWADVIDGYRPELLILAPSDTPAGLAPGWGYHRRAGGGLPVWRRRAGAEPGGAIHPDLAMIIRTSGSLGAPKTVRLSFANLRANAVAIAEALRIRPGDRALASLPLDFSFGLSILNSHLAAGAATGLTSAAPSSAEFWWCADQMRVTCLGAVPATFRFLRARRWDPRDHPSLRRVLQAGGALDTGTIAHIGRQMRAAGGDLVVMYGQTEATARIAYLPPELLEERLGSVGIAIPGGRISIRAPDGIPARDGQAGSVLYQGRNVMMGYARSRKDLAAGDTQRGLLRTGDLGCLRDGFLYLSGRADRQVKALGRRVDLDQVELAFAGRGIAAAAVPGPGERVHVVVETSAAAIAAAHCRSVTARFGLPGAAMVVAGVAEIPRTSRGKVDYAAVRRVVEPCRHLPGQPADER